MAGEALLINPRHRRRRKKARARARTHRRKRARSRRNPYLFGANPRRRRRRGRALHRRGRRRARRNPRIPFLGNVNFNAIGAGTAGYLGTRYGTGFLMSVLPPQWSADPNTAPLVRIGAKAVVGLVALPLLAKTFRLRGVAGPLALGAGIAIAVDLFETYLARFIPIPLADYEQGQLQAYEEGVLGDAEDAGDGSSVYGSNVYGP
jgi:hypothetical protein